jgi:AAA domain, putative AbiEii toxin, Type IV TA system
VIIKRVEVENYKSFRETNTIHLASGFNVIIGPNSGGKSALIEAIALTHKHIPHYSLISSPSRSEPNVKVSKVKTTALIQLFDLKPGNVWQFTYPNFRSPDNIINEFNKITASGGIEIGVVVNEPGGFEEVLDPVSASYNRSESRYGIMSWNAENKQFVWEERNQYTGNTISLSSTLFSLIKSGIYAFKAERLGIGRFQIGSNIELKTDGANLPQVLHLLQTSNPSRYEDYIRLVKRVLPDVQYVTVPPVIDGTNNVEIFVWNESRESRRDDLAVPLTDCGTGVSQVLALLYVVVTSEQPRTLLIDEPQSFLNPGALRRLLEILGEYPQHQYVLATHSPSLLTSLKLSTLAVVSREGTESKIENLDPTLTSTLKSALNGVGAQLSDVYGADRILWVEGPTEEACFPEIIKTCMNRPLNGTVIIGVKHTGDFEDKNKHKAKLAFEVHSKLNLRRPLLPPALGFVFDLEGRSQKDRDDLERQGQAQDLSVPVRFLKRRLYENYLLEPNAIAVVLNADDKNRSVTISPEDVCLWIERHKWDALFFKPQILEAQRNEDRWLKNVHGAKLLHELFRDITESRVEYSKTKHSVDITTELLKTNPGHFSEITEILQDLLPG